MKRTLIFLLVLAALVVALVVVAHLRAQPVSSDTQRAYAPLPPGDFAPIPEILEPEPSPEASSSPLPRRPTPEPTRALIGKQTAPGHHARGVATFYAYVPGGAAAARDLRLAIGPDWRGKHVQVCYAGRCATVVLSDYESSTIEGRLVDLNEATFAFLAGPGWQQRGVLTVEVSW